MSDMIRTDQKQYKHKETGRWCCDTVPQGESLTQKQFASDCDINNIMRKYAQTGELTHLRRNAAAGVYADLSSIGDYHDMMNKVSLAQSAFEDLPAEIKKRFNQDPQQLISFLADEKNRDEAAQLGLITKEMSKASGLIPPAQPSVPPVAQDPGDKTTLQTTK